MIRYIIHLSTPIIVIDRIAAYTMLCAASINTPIKSDIKITDINTATRITISNQSFIHFNSERFPYQIINIVVFIIIK